jgi:hypothetical protein
MFESSTSNIYTREALFEHLDFNGGEDCGGGVLRRFYHHHGAINDFGETLKLAEKMIVYYGMGRHLRR